VLFLLALLTVAYFVAVVWLRRARRTRGVAPGAAQPVADLPVEDQPPVTAVGWPPGGRSFASYIDDGFTAMDAWLSEGHAA
jgi:hypothetical protein